MKVGIAIAGAFIYSHNVSSEVVQELIDVDFHVFILILVSTTGVKCCELVSLLQFLEVPLRLLDLLSQGILVLLVHCLFLP
jgi:hypothetical protein